MAPEEMQTVTRFVAALYPNDAAEAISQKNNYRMLGEAADRLTEFRACLVLCQAAFEDMSKTASGDLKDRLDQMVEKIEKVAPWR